MVFCQDSFLLNWHHTNCNVWYIINISSEPNLRKPYIGEVVMKTEEPSYYILQPTLPCLITGWHESNDEHLHCTRFTSVEHNNTKNFSCLLLTIIYLEKFLLSPSWIQFSCLNHTLDGCWHTLQQFDNKSYVLSFQCRQKNFHETVWWIHHLLVVYVFFFFF